MIECRKCTFHFKRIESLEDGTKIPNEGCVRDLEPDVCHEYQEKWYAGNENGFRDSLEEECMSLEEYQDFLALKDQTRIRLLRKMLKDISSEEGNTP